MLFPTEKNDEGKSSQWGQTVMNILNLNGGGGFPPQLKNKTLEMV